MDSNEYLEMFIEESNEHLQSINNELLKLELEPQDKETINEIFRSAHTFKGMAGAMGFEDLALLTHEMENVLDLVRNSKLTIDSQMMDVIFKCVDLIQKMVSDIEQGGDGKEDVSDVVNLLAILKNPSSKPQPLTQPQAESGTHSLPHQQSDMYANQEHQADQTEQEHQAHIEQLPFQNEADQEEANNEQAEIGELLVDEFQLDIINEAKRLGQHVYQITVTIDKACVMKSIRAFLVFQAAEELGDIIQSEPPVEQLEEENFSDSFTIRLISELDSKEVHTHLMNISEITEVIVLDMTDAKITLSNLEETATPTTTATPETASSEVAIAAPSQEEVHNQTQQHNETGPTATPTTTTATKKKHRSKSIRVDIEKLDNLMNFFSELIIDRGRLEQIAHKAELPELSETVEHMTRISTDLQGLILNMRMVPVEQVFNRFPRMVRDLAKELNKKVQLVIKGADTELDRTVIDEIGDPLVHLLRNALDHGLESTEERIQNGKPEEGTVVLNAFHSGNFVFIEVADDGKGINRDKIAAKAIQRGLVSREEAETLSDQQIYSYLLTSGFSTAEVVTDISGRGVGLDVVKSKIESLGGTISIESTPGKGSTFRIQLPLTLSIIYSMLVKVSDETYAIPFSSIVEITMLTDQDVSTLRGQKVIQFRDQVVSLISLRDVFNVPDSEAGQMSEDELFFVVIVRKGDNLVGIVVDSVIGQQEIVLKSLGNYLTNLFAISGATILGNGEVALIIDTNQFFK